MKHIASNDEKFCRKYTQTDDVQSLYDVRVYLLIRITNTIQRLLGVFDPLGSEKKK